MSPSPNARAMLTIRAAARCADVSERTIRRLIKAGCLPYHRFGRAIRIRESDLTQATRHT